MYLHCWNEEQNCLSSEYLPFITKFGLKLMLVLLFVRHQSTPNHSQLPVLSPGFFYGKEGLFLYRLAYCENIWIEYKNTVLPVVVLLIHLKWRVNNNAVFFKFFVILSEILMITLVDWNEWTCLFGLVLASVWCGKPYVHSAILNKLT